MAKKSLVMYASMTGNTEKVALRFKKVFEKMGWECDMLKVDGNTDTDNPQVDYSRYDFLCVGSPVIKSLPVGEILKMLLNAPQNPHGGRSFTPGATMDELMAEYNQHLREVREKEKEEEKRAPAARQESIEIVFGPDDKKGIVFVSYGGLHQGPKEAEPALALLDSEMEHLRFQCMGRFACPGRFGNLDCGYFKDLPRRPTERDLLKAEIFLEEILERL